MREVEATHFSAKLRQFILATGLLSMGRRNQMTVFTPRKARIFI
jgi:hypothetical protein